MMEKSNRKKRDLINGSANNSRSSPLSHGKDGHSRASSGFSGSSSIETINASQELFNGQNHVDNANLVKGYDMRAHLAQIMMFSEEEDEDIDSSDDDYSIESFDDDDDRDDELRRIAAEGPDEGHAKTPLPTGSNNRQSLVPINEDENEDIDSEEENAIMKEIRNEITNNVRQEMKSELELYQAKMKKLEKAAGNTSAAGTSDEAGGEGATKTTNDAGLDNIDPKLKNAIIKMRKLDIILSKRVKKEKQVKRDRILLERRIRREIEDLHKEKKDEYKEVRTNEEKFLALELPSRHNEGVIVPDEFTGEEVFATQLNEDDYPGLSGNSHISSSRTGHRTRDGGSERSGSNMESRGDASSVTSGSVGSDGKKRRRNRKKDFIKRNKELAADASNTIAMTEEEKKRLDDLLQDVDGLPDMPPLMELDENNPFQLAVKPGDGFIPEETDRRTLTSIDSRLRDLMPPEDYESIASSSLSHLPQNKLFTHTGVKHELDWKIHGERVLFKNAEQRVMDERLVIIDQELAKVKDANESESETPYKLGEEELHELIDQCVTSLSHASLSRLTLNSESRTSAADTESVVSHGTVDESVSDRQTPRSPRSARQELLDNPPKLDPDVLQKLLSEAYNPLSKHLSTLQEEEDYDDDETPIPSEVWKLISEEVLGEDDDSIHTSTDADTLVSVSQSLAETDRTIDMSARSEPYSTRSVDQSAKYEHQPSGEYMKHEQPAFSQFNPVNSASARNGIRTLSRNSSSSSLASVSDLGKDSIREKEPFKLPEIDPSGTLVTQGLNSQRRGGTNSARSHKSQSDSVMDYVGGSDSRLELMSLDGDLMSPHPPPGDKREGSGNNKSRTVTPGSRGKPK